MRSFQPTVSGTSRRPARESPCGVLQLGVATIGPLPDLAKTHGTDAGACQRRGYRRVVHAWMLLLVLDCRKSAGSDLAGVFDGLMQPRAQERQGRQLGQVLADADGLSIELQQLHLLGIRGRA